MVKMEYRPIEVKLICAKDLKNVNVISTMDVYVVGSVSGDPRSMQRTAVHKDGGLNPRWNHIMRFNVDESAARLNRLGLVFQIISDRTLGDKEVGRVYVPLKELYDAIGAKDDESREVPLVEKDLVYQVQTSTGRFKGQLEFTYKFGEKFTQAILDQKLEEPVLPLDRNCTETVSKLDKRYDNELVTAYPARPGNMHGPSPSPGPNMDPGPSVGGATPYNYGAPPPGYPKQGYGYGYPPQQVGPPPNPNQTGYGYGYGYQGQVPPPQYVQQPVQPQKKSRGKMGMGIGAAAGVGAGLLGGMLVGDMVDDMADDVTDAEVYDDMYDY